jgi:hypothetical protein
LSTVAQHYLFSHAALQRMRMHPRGKRNFHLGSAAWQIDWSRAVVDGSSARAVFWGLQTGPNPTDRAKLGSKRHVICDGSGMPLVKMSAVTTTTSAFQRSG